MIKICLKLCPVESHIVAQNKVDPSYFTCWITYQRYQPVFAQLFICTGFAQILLKWHPISIWSPNNDIILAKPNGIYSGQHWSLILSASLYYDVYLLTPVLPDVDAKSPPFRTWGHKNDDKPYSRSEKMSGLSHMIFKHQWLILSERFFHLKAQT